MMIKYVIATALCTTVAAQVLTTDNKRPGGRRKVCLTGRMTDVQNWVDENGDLTNNIDLDYALDLSSIPNPIEILSQQVSKTLQPSYVKYLSMANCKLNRVPSVFQFNDRSGRPISTTTEYLTLYGNEFLDVNAPGAHYGVSMNATKAQKTDFNFSFRLPAISAWAAGFQNVNFTKLQELDLRRCSIQVLNDNIFEGMPELQALYLGENTITLISSNAFIGLRNLLHLDLSNNHGGLDNQNVLLQGNVFKPLDKLTSLDMSFTNINPGDFSSFYSFGKNLERLSVCYTGVPRLRPRNFNGTRLRLLDLTGNPGILNGNNQLQGLEGYLQVLYAEEVTLKSADVFSGLVQLEVLRLRHNELSAFKANVASTLRSLQILDLTNNRMPIWFSGLFSVMPQLQFLSLRDNNLNMISREMLEDIRNISYIALSGNFVVCNCQSKEFFEIAYRNEKLNFKRLLESRRYSGYVTNDLTYHRGFDDYNEMIKARNKVSKPCNENECEDIKDFEADGKFLLVDFEPPKYQCVLVVEGRTVPFYSAACKGTKRDDNIDEMIDKGWNKLLILLIIPTLIFPLLILGFVFRKNFRYFCITMRNSATLSLINNDAEPDEGTIFNYDVFVSYCNDDRNWVLDHLLPHVEKDCNISVCLHERDFQVGLSILENIVSCMDRSRSIMLIISQQFLASRWCQFEMHLAQHRLLETRREDLILVLLEEIPRRLRPTTLHYLMLTKTYIVWPKTESEHSVFWRRLKRSLVMHKIMPSQNISLA